MTHLANETAYVVDNVQRFDKLFLMTLEAPYISKNVAPGQFVQMRIPGMEGHILRRPFSVYDADPDRGTIDILYQTVGYGSSHMAELKALGDKSAVEVIGPIGKSWSAASWTADEPNNHALLVGGGVGSAPLFMLTKHLISIGASVDVVLGAQTKDALVTCDRYTALLGCEPFCATDDGSYGRPGFATSLVEERLANGSTIDGLQYDYVAVCGPPPLMRIVSSMAAEKDIYCEVSLERRMACGIGACLSCVCDTDEGKKRVCVDGPIFDARKVRI